MIWRRAARWAAVLVGLGSAGAVLFFFLSREEPQRPGAGGGSAQPLLDPGVVVEGGVTRSSRFSGSIMRARVSAESWKEYPDGRREWHDVTIEFEEEGLVIRADRVETGGAAVRPDTPREVAFTGNVRLQTDDGLELETEVATYDDAAGVVRMPGEVAFRKQRLSGRGVGALYNREQELFQLEDQAVLDVLPDAEGGGIIHATSRTMMLARVERFLRLTDRARIERPAEVLSADTATLYFTAQEDEITLVDLRGRASVVPRGTGPDSPPEMRATAISLTPHPETRTLARATLTGEGRLALAGAGGRRSVEAAWIDVGTGPDGRTVTALDARDRVVVTLPATASAPARTITSATLAATGEPGRGLRSARFERDVRFTERPGQGEERVATSGTLVLSLDGDLEAIREAEFRERTVFISAGRRATADVAVYGAGADELRLRPATAGGRLPRVTGEDLTVDAREIVLDLAKDNLTAAGDVRTLSSGRTATADASRPGLFEPSKPLIVTSHELRYAGETGRAVYRGGGPGARVLQEGNEIIAGTVVLEREAGDLEATGQVTSRFLVEEAAAAPGSPPVEYRVSGDTLTYRESGRRAVYRGAPARLVTREAESEAAVIELTLAAEGREVEIVTWRDAVYALFEKQHEARGSLLVYVAETGLYTIEGRPAETKLPDESGRGCVRSTGLRAEFNRRTGDVRWPAADNRRGVTNVNVACTTSIR